MSDPVLLAIITGLPATITSLVAALIAWRNKTTLNTRMDRHDELDVEVKQQVKDMHEQTKADNEGTRQAVVKLEAQINSNLEKYIQGAIENALSKERLSVSKLEKK